ncbi:hypothetical protein [Streptomyces celluloflavus]|uniref:hypothetical protein n=1 Tax=Streptomyces celluloflavus TaxID=58344 RepID=UPI0036B01451
MENNESNDLGITKVLEAVDALRLILVSVTGSEQIDEFLIHVEGNTTHFRC